MKEGIKEKDEEALRLSWKDMIGQSQAILIMEGWKLRNKKGLASARLFSRLFHLPLLNLIRSTRISRRVIT